ncbi:MAG: hypothetical protein HYS13_18105 [Planctomycetia bacterium]|nr:hypothetical protein [Planctomycetia bacterium]
MPSHAYLVKDNNELVSHCPCPQAQIAYPPQADCPWCGCGWLFSCIDCRKAFTFARGVQVSEPWEELGRRDLRAMFEKEPNDDDVDEWVEFMKRFLAEVEVGKQYVVFDGRLIPTDKVRLDFDGWHATHQLDFVPQVAALKDKAILATLLSNVNYWESHALGDSTPSALGLPTVRDRETKWWKFWK